PWYGDAWVPEMKPGEARRAARTSIQPRVEGSLRAPHRQRCGQHGHLPDRLGALAPYLGGLAGVDQRRSGADGNLRNRPRLALWLGPPEPPPPHRRRRPPI